MTGKQLEDTLITKGVSQRWLADKMGVTESAVSNWIKRGIPLKKKGVICDVLGIDTFDTGSGVYTENRSEYKENSVLNIDIMEDTASAGHGNDVVCDKTKTVSISRSILSVESSKNLMVVRVDGRSMSPTINHGECVVINTKETSFVGDNLYVLNYANNLMVKRLQFNPSNNSIDIISDNPSYKNYTINLSEDQQYFKIVGLVVSVITKI
jgi:phage repressor protein C with HTH and peptisase S24 domain